MGSKRNLNDNDNESNKKRFATINQDNDDDVQIIVQDLVSELINTTDNELMKLNRNTNDQSIHNHHNYSLDDSFKLNYDFNNLIQNDDDDALFNSSSSNQYDNSFNETITNHPVTISSSLSSTSIVINQTTNEHNYANVPTTSSSQSNLLTSNQHRLTKPTKGVLKFNDNTIKRNKKNVKFKGVTVFYFPRNQGGSTVPSQGGSTLGMEMNHVDLKNFTLDAHAEEKRQVHREILLRQKRYEKMYNQKQQPASGRNLAANQSDSDDDSLENNVSDISDSELDYDSWYFLQPVPVKQRRALLRESGISKIDSSDKEECRSIRLSRENCGCDCRFYCEPETCECSLNGIKCQVDRPYFPCGCTRNSCSNVVGRTEFNAIRVQTHFIHTIMRLELEKKNESQQFNDQSSSSINNPGTSQTHQSLKSSSNNTIASGNSSTATITTDIELNQTTLYSPMIMNNQQSNSSTNLIQTNELYPNDNNNYELYETNSDTTSSYSESDCTSDDLDTGGCLIATNNSTTTTLQSNDLAFINVSPFSSANNNLINSVPTTNVDDLNLINGSTSIISYDNQNYHNQTTTSAAAATTTAADQTFRYYSTTLINPHLQQPTDHHNQLIYNQATTTNNDNQLLNHHHHHLNSYYYQDTTSLYNNNLTTIDCYTNITTPSQQQEEILIKSPLIINDLQQQQQQQQIYHNQQSIVEPFVEHHHYTDLIDLSQSIASSKSLPAELFASTTTLTNSTVTTPFDDLDCSTTVNCTTIVNSSSSSDDSSSSGGQSLMNGNLDDENYLLTSGESTQNNDENNFGEIIKNSVSLESVTA